MVQQSQNYILQGKLKDEWFSVRVQTRDTEKYIIEIWTHLIHNINKVQSAKVVQKLLNVVDMIKGVLINWHIERLTIPMFETLRSFVSYGRLVKWVTL